MESDWNIIWAVGRSSRVLSFSKMSVQLEPNDAEAHNNLGVNLHALDKLES